jgi:NADH dehydrogenase/NADH:ubiquinone oxidoreductase subunit G
MNTKAQSTTKAKSKAKAQSTKAKAVNGKAKAKAESTKAVSGKDAAAKIDKANKESKKVVVYLAENVTSGMIQRSLQTINKLHKADAGGYMYCLKRWLKFADAVNFFSQFNNITSAEISTLPNLAEFRTPYELKQFEKSGKYSVWLIGQLVKRYASKK